MATWETATSADYVDDSEPERKRIRLEAAETKKRRKRWKQRSNTIVTVGSPPFSHAPKLHRSARGDTIDISGWISAFTSNFPKPDVVFRGAKRCRC